LAQQGQPGQVFYGRSKEIELFETLLQSPKGAIIFLGEHGIGKTELLKQLILRARSHQRYRIACAYVRALSCMQPTDPFIDVLTETLNSLATLESESEKVRERLKRLGFALADEATIVLAALLTDIAQKLIGNETIRVIREVIRKYGTQKSEVDEARLILASQNRSGFIYVANTVLAAVHRSNPDIKTVLVLDQFEQISESAWSILLDMIRGFPEQVYIVAAFRHEADIPRNLEKFLMEVGRIQGVHTRELRGLETSDIREWIKSEKNVDLSGPELSRIGRNSGGFPILLSFWISTSANLDPEDLQRESLRKSICKGVRWRMLEPSLDREALAFLRQLSVLQFPPPVQMEPRAYERLMGVDSATVGECSTSLERRWLLDENRERPWFRHDLIKACIEDQLLRSESIELHQHAAEFYEQLFDRAQRSAGEIPFAIRLGCAYHFHRTGRIRESFRHNMELATFAEKAGDLDVADEAFRRAAKDAEELRDEEGLMEAKSRRSGVLLTWGRFEEAEKICQQALAYYRNKGDKAAEAAVLHQLNKIAQLRGNHHEAEAFCRQSLEIRRTLGDEAGICRSLKNLGIIAEHRGDCIQAERLYKESLEIAERLGDDEGISSCLNQLGIIAQDRTDYDEAERLYNRSLEMDEKRGDKLGKAKSLHNLGIVAQYRQRYEEAERLYKESMEIMQGIGDVIGVSRNLCNLGTIAQKGDRFEEAENRYRQSLEINERVGYSFGVAFSLGELGGLLESRRRFKEAENCVSKALEVFTAIGDKPLQHKAAELLFRIREKRTPEVAPSH
jgi:tetratricopeptide (TPR) repeat protein